MSLETEVKIYLPHLAPIQEQLTSLGATLAKPRLFERNFRYENIENSLGNNQIVLRLRQDDRIRLTYKEPYTGPQSAGTITRVELETEVGDFDSMHTILQKLGFHPSVTYEKYRTTYTYSGAEIVLDELPYGHFMEIEGEGESINQIIAQLGLSESPRILESYIGLFHMVKAELNLTVHDLTFANFEGVAVPAHLFG